MTPDLIANLQFSGPPFQPIPRLDNRTTLQNIAAKPRPAKILGNCSSREGKGQRVDYGKVVLGKMSTYTPIGSMGRKVDFTILI